MADPRAVGPQMRRGNHSPLYSALMKRSEGEIVNFCPFQCADHELDDHGYCAHLVGFYQRGTTYEPRERQKNGRVIVNGSKKKPMQPGFKLVRITSTARVYSPTPDPKLAVNLPARDASIDKMEQQEQELLAMAERNRNPVLEGDWGESVYDQAPLATAPA